MARPTKTGLEFFPLDCKMSDEVNLIIADFGITGFGVLISMFQSIYGDKGYYMDWTTREQKLFSRKVGLTTDEVVRIINESVEWGIFNEKQFKENNILTSRRIQSHYATSTYKRVGVTMEQRYLLIDISDKKHINNEVSDDGNEPTTKVSDDKSTQSKVKYSKVEENKQKHIDLYDYWQSKNLHKHKILTEGIQKQLNKLTVAEAEQVKIAIANYEKANNDKSYYYNYKWTLDKFIKQSNGYKNWVEDGQLWIDYKSKSKPKQPKLIGAVGDGVIRVPREEEWD